ncbi:MAG: ATP-dependent Clp protease adaptor ClpS [Hyphomicrobiaceae bacterium]
MRDTPSEIDNLQIVIHNDDETPWDFVVDIVRCVFGRSEAEAKAFTTIVAQQGKAVCGTYPPAVADVMLATAQRRIKEAGYPLLVTVAYLGTDDKDAKPQCGFVASLLMIIKHSSRGSRPLSAIPAFWPAPITCPKSRAIKNSNTLMRRSAGISPGFHTTR